jgi:hypothetical protein
MGCIPLVVRAVSNIFKGGTFQKEETDTFLLLATVEEIPPSGSQIRSNGSSGYLVITKTKEDKEYAAKQLKNFNVVNK